MSPIALQTTSDLTFSGIKTTIKETAPSIAPNVSHTPVHELNASNLIFTRNTMPKAVPEPNSSEVWAQNVCTDHMVTCQWSASTGWAAPELKPYGPLQLMPTASVLHYATEYVHPKHRLPRLFHTLLRWVHMGGVVTQNVHPSRRWDT